MPDSNSLPSPADGVESAAAQWLARRDRGLSTREQAAYATWLRGDARHETAIDRLERTWNALDRLATQHAALATSPDPDLLAPPRRRLLRFWSPLLVASAAAAAVAFVYFSNSRPVAEPAAPRAIVHPGPERSNLEDGSIVELNTGAKVEVNFTPTERQVRLVSGEAYFTVAKNPQRPFIVTANQVAVRAVGTAFSVGLAPREISVLVTEGRVRVDEVLLPTGEKPAAPRELSALGAGQQGLIALSADAARPEMTVTELSPFQVERALFWRGVRLEFVGMPLGDVVAEFNRYNQKKLVVHDAATAAIRVGGNFRADNVDAFIRLLHAGFGVSAFPVGGEIILRKTHDH